MFLFDGPSKLTIIPDNRPGNWQSRINKKIGCYQLILIIYIK